MFRKYVSVFLLVLFVAYSGGVGFSLHHCDHCRKVKVYLFQHPDCCPAAKLEHHHGKIHHHKHCNHQKTDTRKTSPEAYTAHCEQCCVSEFLYFKIKSDYKPNKYNKLDNNANKIASFDLLWKTEKPSFEANNTPLVIKETPPLLPGGDRFIIYSHQLLFYV